jgi:hypothetical protein
MPVADTGVQGDGSQQELRRACEPLRASLNARVSYRHVRQKIIRISIFDYGEVAVKAFFNNMIAARDEVSVGCSLLPWRYFAQIKAVHGTHHIF